MLTSYSHRRISSLIFLVQEDSDDTDEADTSAEACSNGADDNSSNGEETDTIYYQANASTLKEAYANESEARENIVETKLTSDTIAIIPSIKTPVRECFSCVTHKGMFF